MQSLQGIDSSISSYGSQSKPPLAGSAGDTLGWNVPTMQLGLSGLNTVGGLYGAYQANDMANQQFDYAKKMGDANLANQIKSYNTNLSDKATARGSVEGWTDAETQSYINSNKL